LLKIVLSGLLISVVTQIAKKAPTLAGWIAALPLISILSAVWLHVEHQSSAQIASFLVGVAVGLVPTALMLLTVAASLRYGLQFGLSLAIGLGVWGVAALIGYGHGAD
jgi:hypothetical protein